LKVELKLTLIFKIGRKHPNTLHDLKTGRADYETNHLQILKQASEDSKNIHGTDQPTKNFIRHLKSEPTQNKSNHQRRCYRLLLKIFEAIRPANKSVLVKLNDL